MVGVSPQSPRGPFAVDSVLCREHSTPLAPLPTFASSSSPRADAAVYPPFPL